VIGGSGRDGDGGGGEQDSVIGCVAAAPNGGLNT
jgi:hypothetical protein